MKKLDINENFKSIKWSDVKDGDLVYLFTRVFGLPDYTGPFTVVSAEKRQLRKLDCRRVFIHYPEELYQSR